MSPTQVQHFATEMRENNAYLGRVRVLGGEPTAHPKLAEISEILCELVKEGHVGALEMVTNASNMDAVHDVRHFYNKVRRSDENEKQKTHTANLVHTPAILGYRGKVCSAPTFCGISLNYYGYFPCSSGAGLARLMDDMERWQRLSLPKKKPLEEWSDLEDLCQHCFHALKPEHKIKCGTDKYELNVPHPKVWNFLGGWLNGKKPEGWKVYGQS